MVWVATRLAHPMKFGLSFMHLYIPIPFSFSNLRYSETNQFASNIYSSTCVSRVLLKLDIRFDIHRNELNMLWIKYFVLVIKGVDAVARSLSVAAVGVIALFHSHRHRHYHNQATSIHLLQTHQTHARIQCWLLLCQFVQLFFPDVS